MVVTKEMSNLEIKTLEELMGKVTDNVAQAENKKTIHGYNTEDLNNYTEASNKASAFIAKNPHLIDTYSQLKESGVENK